MARMTGAPNWKDALIRVAIDCGFSTDEVGELQRLQPKDIAQLLEARCGRADTVRQVLRYLDPAGAVGLVHCILASLPVNEYVCASFDSMLTRASAFAEKDGDKRIGVMPYEATRRWQLALNGHADFVDSISLTGNTSNKPATASSGVVQALLLTKHVLFLGFRLQSDDTMHAILDSVQRARSGGGEGCGRESGMNEGGQEGHGGGDTDQDNTVESGRDGGGGGGRAGEDGDGYHAGGDAVFSEELNSTLLQRLPNTLERELWKQINTITLEPHASGQREGARTPNGGTTSPHSADDEMLLKQHASRRLEILLDFIALHSRLFSSHVLNGSYQGHLSPKEKDLIHHLEVLVGAMRREMPDTNAACSSPSSSGIATRVVHMLDRMFRRIGLV